VPTWPWFVLGGRDPAASVALRAYAAECERLGFDSVYVADVRRLADEFAVYVVEHGAGNPTGPKHRADDPAVVERLHDAANWGDGSL
jgi:alkanesulfonate monooxygenase SsuD/methylene tetrahydromethanopterin reductase-like flavin-dependent oxidoreductase (luciferase family)